MPYIHALDQGTIAYQVADLLDAVNADAGIPPQELRVDGGASANNLLMQFQADLTRSTRGPPAVIETTAPGAAYLASLAVGYWRDTQHLSAQWRAERRFEPQMPQAKAGELRERWRTALERAKGWEARSK